jgi:biotin carboxyl carrier protein
MPTEIPGLTEESARALSDLSELRRWAGAPREFWPRFLASVGSLTGARKVSLLFKDASEPPRWQTLQEWSAQTGPARPLVAFATQLDAVAERCLHDGRQFFTPDGGASRNGPFVIAARLKFHRSDEAYIVACLLQDVAEGAARDALVRLNLAADVPESYQVNQFSRVARADVEKFAVALDVLVQMNAEKRFLAAALAFCNGLATRFNCDRVSLGWLQGGYLKLRALSRTEKFDRQMAAAKALEVAMEEALDQDEEILWPPPEGATVVTRDHEAFARGQSVAHLCSLPLRVDDKAVAVLTCERQAAAFTPLEVQQLRLTCDQAVRRLSELRHHDRWFGARWATFLKEQCARLVGPEHTWAKVLGLVIALALALLFFLRVPYRVEGNFLLRSDEVAYLTAPFDGYISQVHARPGDAVAAAGRLLTLNTAELELEESAALADLNRYQREAEKARAARQLAEMRIAEALAQQSKARLDLVRYRLDQAVIKSPFVGVVIEGDLRERLGAPVKQGDALFKIARTETLYVEAEVDERDVHELAGKTTGEIAFVSQPKLKFPVRIVAIEPAAVPKNQANVFLVRLAVEGGPQPWWRPGMSGVCKLNVEKRTLFWIITHRTVDFLRLWLWW